jgi:cell division cycle 20-like protein 1 (cofactor of APC complex)
MYFLSNFKGYSENQIVVWNWKNATLVNQLRVLKGHQRRVLYLSTSPDGKEIVTGAGDETLRIWTLFNKSKKQKKGFEKILTLR